MYYLLQAIVLELFLKAQAQGYRIYKLWKDVYVLVGSRGGPGLAPGAIVDCGLYYVVLTDGSQKCVRVAALSEFGLRTRSIWTQDQSAGAFLRCTGLFPGHTLIPGSYLTIRRQSAIGESGVAQSGPGYSPVERSQDETHFTIE